MRGTPEAFARGFRGRASTPAAGTGFFLKKLNMEERAIR